MIKGPCKGCPERDAPDCRIMCPAWLEYQAKLAAEREAKIRKETGDKSEKRYRNIQYLHLAVKALAAFILGIFVMYILKLS